MYLQVCEKIFGNVGIFSEKIPYTKEVLVHLVADMTWLRWRDKFHVDYYAFEIGIYQKIKPD